MKTIPDDLRYSKDHVWVRVDEDKRVTVGITEYAQDELGEVVYLELPEEGDDVSKDELMGNLESSKSVNDLNAPISGTVAEVNSEVLDAPELINEDPYNEGWLVRIEPSRRTQIKQLMTAEEYEEMIKAQAEEDEDEDDEDDEDEDEGLPGDDDDDDEAF
jgi:glycine cleavage system H protein